MNQRNETPLHEACRNGNDVIASYLIDECEDIEALKRDYSGRQALTYAASSGLMRSL